MNPFGEVESLTLLAVVHASEVVHPGAGSTYHITGAHLKGLSPDQIRCHHPGDFSVLVIAKIGHFSIIKGPGSELQTGFDVFNGQAGIVRPVLSIVSGPFEDFLWQKGLLFQGFLLLKHLPFIIACNLCKDIVDL